MPTKKTNLKKTIDYPLLIAVIALTLFGAYMILSATYYKDIFDESNNPLTSFLSSFKKSALGLFLMIVVTFSPAKYYKKYAAVLMILSVLFLMFNLIFGDMLNGSKRSLAIMGFAFAPAELTKLAMILYFAKIFEHMNKNEERYNWAWASMLLFGGGAVVMIYRQPDLSTSFILACTIGGMLLVAGPKKMHLIILVSLGAVLVVFAIMSQSYRLSRIDAFGDDTFEINGDSAQQVQALMSIARGKIYGVGPGEAYQTKYNLSHAENDLIFSTVAETTGFLGATVLISVYIFVLWRMARIATYVKSYYAALVVTGVLTMIGLQALIHMFVNTKIMPVTGVTLPLISTGGTSVIVTLISVGIVLNFSSDPEGL